MSTLVTGAAGFLGSHVARQLVARGDEVRVLLRASSTNRAIADLPLEDETGDLRDPTSLDRAMKGVKRVFHVAADYRLWARRSQDIYDSNVGGTKNLLDSAKRAGVEECAAGQLLVAEKGKVGERYMLGGENLTLKQMLDTLAKITGLRAPSLKIPHGLALGVAYANTAFSRLVGREPGIPVEGVKIAQHMMFVDCSRAQRELGFQAGPVAAALDVAVRWYEANRYIAKNRAKP